METRISGNIVPFAQNATVDKRWVFGESDTESDDINLNLNEDFKAGWENGVDVDGYPLIQWFNAQGFTISKLIAYLYQQGIAQYDSAQTYYINSFVVGGDGLIYRSKTNNNTGNLVTDTTNWESLDSKFVQLTGNQTIAGTKTFSSTISGNVTGNSGTATILQTARTINGTSFNGSANITTASWGTARSLNGVSVDGSADKTLEPYIERDDSTNATRYLAFVDSITAGYQRLNMDTNLGYNPSTNMLTANLTGAVTGNATTATTLQTSRTINGVSFNGSANITVGVDGNNITWATSATAGKFDTSATTPTGTTRLNYGGYFYPTALNLVGQADTTTSPSHIMVETGTDGFVRPQTLAQFRTNLFAGTTAIGDATATTKTTGDNTTAVATTAFVQANKDTNTIGVSQTWQNVTSSRIAGTTYTNSTGRPIQVSISLEANTNNNFEFYINGVLVANSDFTNSAYGWNINLIIPNGSTYSTVETGVISRLWFELR